MTRLSTIDGGFLLTESHHSPKHIGVLIEFQLPKGKGRAWLRKLLDDMRGVEPGFPFNQRVRGMKGLQYELEFDEHLEPDYHIRHTVLPSPGNDRQLLDVLGRMHANLLDRERPLWEFHLIEGLSDRRFAFYIKIHHALADGITFGRWLSDCSSRSPDDRSTLPIWGYDQFRESDGDGQFDLVKILLDGIANLGSGIDTALGLTRLTAKMIQRRFLDHDLNIALPLSAPKTSINVATGAARKLSFTSYRLADLRAIGKARGGSINDVVMTLCDLALNRYFEQHGEPPEGPLVAYMPVNIRTEEEDSDGNLVTLLQVKLASDHGDALEAFDEVRESIASAREVFSGVPRLAVQYYSLMVALMSLAEEALKLDRVLPPVNNLVISNVPGPQEKLYYQGAEVVGMYPVSTLPPITALNVTAVSYAGKMYFGLIAGRSVVPDLAMLTSFLDEAFHDLADAAGITVDD
jgi:diacylglycerol O-acyltransferase